MGRSTRIVLLLLGFVFLALTILIVSSTIFLNGEGLRARVEQTLSRAIGRDVHIGSLRVSLVTGRLVAEQMRIADDPAFGGEPFLQADRVDMGIEVWPLLLRRQVSINAFTLRHPSIRLLRDASGTWNYQSFALPKTALPTTENQVRRADTPPPADLAISTIAIDEGSVLVRVAGAAGPDAGTRDRLYNHVNLTLHHVSPLRAFPLRLSADLPEGGQLRVDGTGGPWNRAAGADTPFAGHLEVRHLDLAAAGLAGSGSGLRGLVQKVAFELAWSHGTLAVRDVDLDSPQLTWVRPDPQASAQGQELERAMVWRDLLAHLQVQNARISCAALTVAGPGPHQATYRDVKAHIERWAEGEVSPFSVTAVVPGDGSVAANGTLQQAPEGSGEAPRVRARVNVRHLDLRLSGLLSPGSAVRGSLNLEAQVESGQGTLKAAGTTRIERLALATNGQPSAQPVLANFVLTERQPDGGESVTGTLERATVTIGQATANVSGTFRTGAAGSTVDLRVSAGAVPIDAIEAFLPALAIELPEGSRLSGGTVSTSLAVVGASPHLAITGPVRLAGTHLNGFNLGAQLSSLARFTGGRIGSATGPGTTIRSLSFDLDARGGDVRTANIAAAIAGIGTATGDGTVGPGATLKYALSLKLTELIPTADGGAGLARQLAQQLPGAWASRALGAIDYLTAGPMKNGIPILIGGTARHPTFTPNLGALLPAERPRR